jgi:hypothetical protein
MLAKKNIYGAYRHHMGACEDTTTTNVCSSLPSNPGFAIDLDVLIESTSVSSACSPVSFVVNTLSVLINPPAGYPHLP